MEKVIFFVVCSLAVFEGYMVNSQLNVDNLDPTDELPISERAELRIINLCTEVPPLYEEFMESFSNENPLSSASLQRIQDFETQLKVKTDELRQYVTKYDQSVSAAHPDVESQNEQNIMSSALDELVQSINKINNDLNTEIRQTSESAGVDKRPELVQQYVRPSMVKFEEFCLLQTKDILKNILQDYEATLLS